MMSPRTWSLYLIVVAVLLFACSKSDGVPTDAGTDTGAPPSVCSIASAGEACAPDGTTCTDTIPWCGEEVAASGCNCNNGKWECWAAGAPAPCCTGCEQGTEGDACCLEFYGATYTCGTEESCVEDEACKAIDCCNSGAEGDAFCASNFGDCSTCVEGHCTPLDCCDGAEAGAGCTSDGQLCEETGEHCGEEIVMSSCTCEEGSWLCATLDLAPCCMGCAQDFPGHACCAEFNNEMFYCGSEGACIEAPICDSADCCVPGEPGDAYCKDTFEECSFCIPNEGGGMCSRTACPDTCTQDTAGHNACQLENSDAYFCGSEGTCIPASGCLALFCCVPGTKGDSWCASSFGDCSQCAVVNDDGACDPQFCE